MDTETKYEECKGCGKRIKSRVMGEDLLCVHCAAIEECQREEEHYE